MNKLWAPWRIHYIRHKKAKGCIFCKVFKDRRDKKNSVVLRSLHCFVLLNTFPYNNGHLMIVSNRHVPGLENLKEEEILDTNKTIIKMLSVLKRVLKPEGFNVGINVGKCAGAGIEKHLHIHVVPRWAADTNFMPLIADTKIISQSLRELYDQMKKEL
ncbi:MAG: HIT domain-containing protein [Candidatus Omnitrophota bacterium]|nr:MAG: HIT domain-containing protein [Candidatus Omnitrophota bacterium]